MVGWESIMYFLTFRFPTFFKTKYDWYNDVGVFAILINMMILILSLMSTLWILNKYYPLKSPVIFLPVYSTVKLVLSTLIYQIIFTIYETIKYPQPDD